MVAQSESLLNVVLEALESHKNHGQIIEAVMSCCSLHYFVCNQTTNGAECGRLDARQVEMLASLESCDVPNDLINVFVSHFVENTIRSDQDIVEDLRAVRFKNYFWFICNASWDSPQVSNFSFNVSESPANGKPARVNPVRAHKRVFFLFRIYLWWLIYFYLNHLRLRYSVLHGCLCLVNVAPYWCYSLKLFGFWGFVVQCNLPDLTDIALTVHLADAGHSTTVSNVNNINIFVYYKNH